MLAVNDLFDLLGDGKWHNLSEIGAKTMLSEPEVEHITKFLVRYDFVDLKKREKRAKLNDLTLDFLMNIRRLEQEEPL